MTLDTRKIWRLSNELLRAETTRELVCTLFDGGRDLFPFDSSVFFPLDAALFRPADSGHLGRGINAGDMALDYALHYHKVDPLRVVEKPDNHNRALRTHDVVSSKEYRNSEILQDFYRPAGIEKVMGICVVGARGPVCGIGLHREKGARAFSTTDADRMTMTAPAIALGLERLRLRDGIDRLLLTGHADSDKQHAVWLLDRRMAIHNSNGMAQDMTAEWARLRRYNSKHPFPAPVTTLIERLCRIWPVGLGFNMTPPVAESITYELGGRWYTFTVTMVGALLRPGEQETIIVTAIERSSRHDFDEVVRGLGLSKREREIALMVVRGQTNKEIAQQLGIVEQTAKDHLRSIFFKAGVNSRARLIAKLLGSP